jgi:putative FmdB family regulatory protein
MPTYEYVCDNCKAEWEVMHSITREPIKECPSCASTSAKRLISGGTFKLEGDGWAKDNYTISRK